MIVYLKFFFFTPLKLTFTFESGRTRLNHFYFPCKINFIFFKQSKEHAGLFLLPYVGSTVQIELARHPSSSDVHNASQQNQAVIFHLIQNQYGYQIHTAVYLGSPHFLAQHPPAQLWTSSVRGIRTYSTKRGDG